jgi:DNA repair protein RadC
MRKAQACGHITGAHGFCFAPDLPESPALPSEAGRQLTRRVADAARLLKIHLLDHVICGARVFFSFKGAGLPYALT